MHRPLRPHCVRWGPMQWGPSPHSRSSPLFGPCLLPPNGRPSHQLLSSCYLLTFRSLSETFIRKKNLLISSSGSCDDSDATWQEIGCTCGSACSCLSSRFKDCSPSFRICTKDTRTYALPLSCSLSLIHLVLLLIYYWHTLLTYGDGFCVMCVCLQIKVENFCW